MAMVINPDEFSRTAKLLVDRDGRSFREANAELLSRVLQIDIGPGWPERPGSVAGILTAVNCGARAFLGGVNVRLAHDADIGSGWGTGMRLSQAVQYFGARVVERHQANCPTIAFGDTGSTRGSLKVYATWSGWSGGVVTSPSERLDKGAGNPLSGMLAGAVGVSEMFRKFLSRTRPGETKDWSVALGSQLGLDRKRCIRPQAGISARCTLACRSRSLGSGVRMGLGPAGLSADLERSISTAGHRSCFSSEPRYFLTCQGGRPWGTKNPCSGRETDGFGLQCPTF